MVVGGVGGGKEGGGGVCVACGHPITIILRVILDLEMKIESEFNYLN